MSQQSEASGQPEPAPAFDLADFFEGSLTTLAVGPLTVPAMVGHFDPEDPGVGRQFLQDAADYDQRYLAIDGMAAKLARAMDRAGPESLPPQTIMDVGSGSGNSVFALAKLYPDAQIIASDLSPNMVAIMQDRASSMGISGRLTTMVADASKLEPRAHRFDLIVGSSMLHHMVDPFDTLRRLLMGLRPDGIAIFYEPFQAGNVVLRQCLREIMRRIPEHDDLPPNVAQVLANGVFGLDLLFDEARTHPVLPRLDDKWIFTRRHFEDAARHLGLPPPVITSTNPPQRTWEHRVAALLRGHLGAAPLPAWVTEILRSADHNVSTALREELLMEGEIIFRGTPSGGA